MEMELDGEWIIIEVDEDRRRLASDADKLEKCYPERYDFRITPAEPANRFALAVRHRD
ncbi:MAG: hypothetical protein H6744_08800 [Deltaproteobacteria bacterium]|nr:hypothetical protein [Deltaproteobacteria bacterium]MCB9786777.1 hypothetical protein [Deltaproteobacteria bacterium]